MGLAHHRELSVSKPHHPASSVSCPTPTAHPPGDDPAGPPGEAPQLPEHQRSDAEASAILSRGDRLHVKKGAESERPYVNNNNNIMITPIKVSLKRIMETVKLLNDLRYSLI